MVVTEDEREDRQGGEGKTLKGADRRRGRFGEGRSKRVCLYASACVLKCECAVPVQVV